MSTPRSPTGSATSKPPMVVADHAKSSVSKKEEDYDRAKTCAREWAEEVKKNLDPKHPSFVKSMNASVNRSTPQVVASAEAQSKVIDKAEVLADHDESSAKKGAFADDDDDSDKTCAREQEEEVVADHAESSQSNRALTNDSAKTNARVQAEEVQKSLDPKHPSFLKSVVKSHVSGCYHMYLPTKFCNSYLLENDYIITLVVENKAICTVQYMDEVFRGGWKAFSIGHNLVEGDSMVFHLVKRSEFQVYVIRAQIEDVKFKVYIIRTDGSSGDIEGSGLCSLNVKAKKNAPCKRTKRLSTPEKTERKRRKTPLSTDFGPEEEKPKISRRDAGSEGSRGTILWGNLDTECRLSTVDGLKQNSKLSEHIWLKYYDLYCS
ncbi:hypothetical protein GIB67_019172 [Kingdonia uniflora]|uniref:TF-B3 domain-containing protein n=1 Tax=Kingdonia uniflora TaxID=39325 RepID=A0A7J7MZS9_9MAGN|nr:hypothetical protein GIB67_019172 [Kingdonia uniflora]